MNSLKLFQPCEKIPAELFPCMHACTHTYTHKRPYQCEAAVLLPRRTAAAGLLLTAAPPGRCFSETAANGTMTGEQFFHAD